MEKKKGSITVFMALMLSILVALVCSSVESVRMAAARTQILCGMDVGLYSVFAEYDRELLEEYDVFFLDGSYGSKDMNYGRVYDTFRDYMEPVLGENYQKLTWQIGGITGCTLATDEQGRMFYNQAAAHMKKTLGAAGLQLLLDKTAKESRSSENAQELWENAGETQSLSSYDEEMVTAAQRSHEASEKAKEEHAKEDAEGEFQDDNVGGGITPTVENPIPTIRRIQRLGLLELILPEDRTVSEQSISLSSTLSHRNLQQGLGSLQTAGNQGIEERILFQEYIMKKCGNFRNPSSTGMAYETEYILHGKSSDRENLKAVVGQLLLIREGINFGYLLTDAEKMSQAELLAMGICSAFLIPPAAGIVKMVLVLCWSFAESVLDVRSLLAGEKVPLVKSPQTWQLSLSNLSQLLERRDSDRRTVQEGMDYEGYLRALLLIEGQETVCFRCMDMVENQIRQKGRTGFSLDRCIGALELSVDVQANDRKTYTVARQFAYI